MGVTETGRFTERSWTIDVGENVQFVEFTAHFIFLHLLTALVSYLSHKSNSGAPNALWIYFAKKSGINKFLCRHVYLTEQWVMIVVKSLWKSKLFTLFAHENFKYTYKLNEIQDFGIS